MFTGKLQPNLSKRAFVHTSKIGLNLPCKSCPRILPCRVSLRLLFFIASQQIKQCHAFLTSYENPLRPTSGSIFPSGILLYYDSTSSHRQVSESKMSPRVLFFFPFPVPALQRRIIKGILRLCKGLFLKLRLFFLGIVTCTDEIGPFITSSSLRI